MYNKKQKCEVVIFEGFNGCFGKNERVIIDGLEYLVIFSQSIYKTHENLPTFLDLVDSLCVAHSLSFFKVYLAHQRL